MSYVFISASCERTKDKMYKPLNGAFCFKRLTAEGEYGCTCKSSLVVSIILNKE